MVNFRRHDVWQRRCVHVQLRKAIHDVYFRFFGNGDDLYYDVSWARDGAGKYAKWQDLGRSPLRIAAVTDFHSLLALLMLFLRRHENNVAYFCFYLFAGLFALSAPLQILLLQNAKGGELLGGAGGQIAFNLGSAVGAYCGGMMLTLGLAYNYVALPAALLSFAAMSSLLLYGRYKRQQAADSPVLAKPLGKIYCHGARCLLPDAA